MKTTTIGGCTVTLTESTYADIFGQTVAEAMAKALEDKDFETYNLLKQKGKGERSTFCPGDRHIAQFIGQK